MHQIELTIQIFHGGKQKYLRYDRLSIGIAKLSPCARKFRSSVLNFQKGIELEIKVYLKYSIIWQKRLTQLNP
jgi:hypothetical protein